VNVTVVRPADLGPAERAEWSSIQRSDPTLGSPFLAPEFAVAVGTTRNDARVAVVTDVGTTIGYHAFQANADGTGAPIGATICDTQAFIAHAAAEWNAGELVAGEGLSAWTFDHLVPSQRQFVPYHQVVHVSPCIDLSDGHTAFEAAVRAQSRDLLSQVARRRRKLARDVGDVVTEWQSPTPGVDLAALMRWKSDQYAATGVWDRFAQPWITDVITRLSASTASGCEGLLTTTRAGGQLVAVHLGLLGPTGLSWWFPAYDPAFAPYSPGLILLLDLVQQAADRRITDIDLGRGEHSYKLRVATSRRHVAEGIIPASGAGA
jgi:CelD/BcsL family acetyltransferase involved in cellulose biosynthesis